MSNPYDPPPSRGAAPGWSAPPDAGASNAAGPPSGSGTSSTGSSDAGLRIGVGVGFGLFLLVVLVAGLARLDIVSEPRHPGAWDPRVAELATFVQDERGLLFEHPVAVDFLTEEEFRSEVTSGEGDLTDEDRADIEDSTAELRALGLVEGDFDLFGESNEISGDTTLAYYNPGTERIAVRGEELTPYLRATIAHEMTHALQDQHFDLAALQDEVGPDGDFRFRSVVEGDAVGVQRAYVMELSEEEQEEFVDEELGFTEGSDDDGDSGDEGGSDYSPALAAFFGSPYALGPGFVGVLDAVGGNSDVNDALEVLPSSEAAILDPSLYYAEVEPTTVADPEVGDGFEELDGGTFGALSWYLVLASRVDEHDALAVVDSWRGDRYVTYRDGDRVCVTAHYRADDAGGLDRARSTFEEWADAMPDGAASVSDVGDETIELNSCDPGAEAEETITNDVVSALALPAVRLQIAAEVVGQDGVEFDQAWCLAEGVVDEFSSVELQAEELPAGFEDVIIEIGLSCR